MLTLVIPELKDYWYEKKLNEDPASMSYNAGYDVSYSGYHYDTGTIDFPEENFEKDRYHTKVFEDVGFKVIKETTGKKFGKDVEGVIVKIEL